MYLIVRKSNGKVVMHSESPQDVDLTVFSIVGYNATADELASMCANAEMTYNDGILSFKEHPNITKQKDEQAVKDALVVVKDRLDNPGITLKEVANSLTEVCRIIEK